MANTYSLVFSRFVDIVSRTNTIMEYIFILLRGAAAVDREYSVRLVIAALLVDCFVQLCIDFMVNEGLVSHYLERENQVNN